MALVLWEQPQAKRMTLIIGWRQWADAGSVSSGLPAYLIDQLNARQIGYIPPDGYYLFQIPGTHDLVRPMVKFEDGYPAAFETQQNNLYYAEHHDDGILIFLGDEPHLNAQPYVDSILEVAQTLKADHIIGCAGVYGELPYDKARIISCIYSQPSVEADLADLVVDLSSYEGGASIGSLVCHRATQQSIPYVGFYALVPTYDFSEAAQIGNTIRIENDFMAWLGILQRVNHWLKLRLDLSDLKQKSERLKEVMAAKIDELSQLAPELGVSEYFQRLSDNFNEVAFDPLDDVWEDELRRLLDEDDSD